MGLFNEANILCNNKEYTKAIAIYKKCIDNDEETEQAYYNLGTCYIKMKEYNKAIDTFRTVLKINDTYANAYYNLGYVYSMIDDCKKAYRCFNIAWSLNNEDQECEKAIKLLENKLNIWR
jgi:tetratricopeptide (TPR) repeat protein